MHLVFIDSNYRGRKGAFSLIEVVVALGVFAIAIVGVLGLLSPTSQAVRDTLDGGTASRLAETVNAEIERLGYSAVVPSALVLSADVATLSASDARLLYSNRSGSLICKDDSATGDPNYIPPSERYFEILLVRNETLSSVGNDTTAGFVAFAVQTSWPARVNDGTGTAIIVPREERSIFSFNAAVRR